jgi:hypothetical protein
MEEEKDITPFIEAAIRDWIVRNIEFENPDDPNSWFRLRPERESHEP